MQYLFHDKLFYYQSSYQRFYFLIMNLTRCLLFLSLFCNFGNSWCISIILSKKLRHFKTKIVKWESLNSQVENWPPTSSGAMAISYLHLHYLTTKNLKYIWQCSLTFFEIFSRGLKDCQHLLKHFGQSQEVPKIFNISFSADQIIKFDLICSGNCKPKRVLFMVKIKCIHYL